jgi:predicted secreted protein
LCRIIGIALILIAIGSSGINCNSPEKDVPIAITCFEFEEQHALADGRKGTITKAAELSVGGNLTLTICSNPSDGFAWDLLGVSDEEVVRPRGHGFIAPDSDSSTPAPGTPWKEFWTFDALTAGTSEVRLEYSRTWPGGEKAVWSLALTVTVH